MLPQEDISRLHLLKKEPGATEGEIKKLQDKLGRTLPEDYLDLLRHCNGAYGDMGGEQFWFVLWSAAEVPGNNDGYCVSEFAPGLVLFASDGGGTAFGIDTRSGDPQKMDYCQFGWSFLGWDEIEHRCHGLSEFLEYLATAE